jgi:hypothetical protein
MIDWQSVDAVFGEKVCLNHIQFPNHDLTDQTCAVLNFICGIQAALPTRKRPSQTNF